ncbi:MAG: hypothetical protein JWN44_3618, partial [Myxococcales bacterium]|nr:hypothetical protein [Myxococcales bacterium]
SREPGAYSRGAGGGSRGPGGGSRGPGGASRGPGGASRGPGRSRGPGAYSHGAGAQFRGPRGASREFGGASRESEAPSREPDAAPTGPSAYSRGPSGKRRAPAPEREQGGRGRGSAPESRAPGGRGRGASPKSRGGDRPTARPDARERPRKSGPPPTATVRAHTKLPEVVPGPSGPPRPGEWVFATRPGAEIDLMEELFYGDEHARPRIVSPSLVAASRKPGEPAFARQGFKVLTIVEPDGLGRAVASVLAGTGAPQPWAFDVWVPDSDEANRLNARATEIHANAHIEGPWARLRVGDARAALAENGLYAQACLLPPGDRVAVGVGPARDAPSLAPGGRLRVHVSEQAPSRAAMKLLEAFLWLDRSPEPGDVCVDLGAAPGGWTWVLLERRARVYAVDPAFMARSLQGKPGLEHIRADAFKFDPTDPVDWLFSDMAWRPLESAALLAKWARRGWARLMIANIKLPMKKKAEMLVRVREILTDAGWKNLRIRQLYHDREEVTIAAVRL